MTLRVGKYAPDANEEEKRSLMQALINLGMDAAGIYPNTSDIQIIESNKQSSADIYERLARFCDEQISKAVLGQTLTSDSGGGSFAQSKTHNEVRHDLTIADAKALARTLRRDLITPLVRINFGLNVKIPTVKFDCEESEDLKSAADMYNVLINDIGLQIGTEHIYKKFGIPKPENKSDIAAGRKIEMPSFGTPYKLLANKSNTDAGGGQQLLDNITDFAVGESAQLFKKSFNSIEEMLQSAESLEELQAMLDDEKHCTSILKSMQNKELDNLLANTMFIQI